MMMKIYSADYSKNIYNERYGVQKCSPGKFFDENTRQQYANTNITPSMLGLKINRPSFDAGIRESEFPKKDVKIIQNLLKKCKYGYIQAIRDPSKINVEFENNNLCKKYILHNFQSVNDGDDEFNGVCYELSHAVGKRLQEQFRDKYIIVGINGYDKEYHMSHTYLLMLKGNSENRSTVSRYFEDVENIRAMAQEIDFSAKENRHSRAEAKNKILISPSKFKNALLIDPSFNIIKEFDDNSIDKKYSHNILAPLDALNIPDKKYSVMEGDFWGPIEIPIGFIKDIAPELSFKYGKNSLLFIGLEESGNKLDATLYVIEQDGGPDRYISVEKHLNKKNPLIKFLDKVRSNK